MTTENLIRLEFKSLLTIDEGDANLPYYEVEAYGSTFGNTDRDGDVMMPGAFSESLKEIHPKLLVFHDMRELPVGKIIEIYEDEKGLKLKARLPKEDTFVRDRLVPQIKVGSMDSMSIGFVIKDSERLGGVRQIKSVSLYEISFVSIPANPLATISSIKTATSFQDLPLAPVEQEWDASAAISRIKELTGSQEAPSSDYKKAFLWFDTADSKNFGAYQLPIADVIDGKMKTVPRAIFEAAAALQGARGGVGIPEASKDAVINAVERCYDNMDKDSPFKSFSVLLEGLEDFKSIERVLGFKFDVSRTEAKALVSTIKRVSESVQAKEAERDADLENSEEKGLQSLLESIQKATNSLTET